MTAPQVQVNSLIVADASGDPSMTSREIADLVESRHDKVKQSIDRLIERGVIVQPPMGDEPLTDAMGRPRSERIYRLCKRDSYVVVAQLSPEFTARLVDRWEQLERQVRQPVDLMKALDDPAFLRQALSHKNEEVATLRAINDELAPKALALDRIATAGGSMCVTDAAKTMQVQPKALFQFLRSHRWVYTRAGGNELIAFQDKLVQGLLEHKTTTVTRSDGSEKVTTQVRVTPKGLTRLVKELEPVARAA
jgi:phage antirepressor YoqD-like protein